MEHRKSVPTAIAVAASASASAAAPALPASTSTALLRPIAALAIHRPVAARFEGHGGGLSAAGTDYGGSRAHAATATVAAFVLGVRGRVTTAGSALLCLAARLAAAGRGVATFLEKLLLPGCKDKFLTAVATSK